jgi:hypothetical protein
MSAARWMIWLGVVAAAMTIRPAAAGAASFTAAIDRQAAAPGQPFLYEVKLTLANETHDNFRPPNFRGLQVLQTPGGPNTAMSVQMGGGNTVVQNTLTWQFQLALPAGARGTVTIAPARVRVGGHEMTTNSVAVRVGAAGTAPPQQQRPQRPPGLFPRGLFGDVEDDGGESHSSPAGKAFIRAVADKQRAFVGEQVTVTWYLYVVDMPNQFQPVTQPRTDGFWSEDIPSTNPQGRLAFTDEVQGGQRYQVATLQQKALFPLAPGKLVVTPMEAQVAQVDFFGRPVRARKLKSEPISLEAMALPGDGQPPRFKPANVGRYTLEVAADRTIVAVGDAVTITVSARGTGNVRNLVLPPLPPLAGWKSYEPKTDAAVDAGAVITGTKTVEWLLRPERAGNTTVPPLSLVVFDPAARRYVETHTQPIELSVTGETAGVAAAPAAPGAAVPGDGRNVDNVLAAQIRPIRVSHAPARAVSVSFLRGPAFTTTLVVPPLAFVALAIAGRWRERLSRDVQRTSRRRVRSIARRRLGAAADHMAAGRAAAFYVEIERVLRETLSERLRVPVAGLRLDELGDLLRARGLADADAAAVVAALERCDEARFAPGGAAAERATLEKALDEAALLLDVVGKARPSAEAKA